MNSVAHYKSILEKEIHNNIIFLIFFSLFFILALFLLVFLHKKLQSREKPSKIKTQRKQLDYQKTLKRNRIELAVIVSVLLIIYCCAVYSCVMDIADCRFDIKHENYITYSGYFDVTTELSVGKGSHRTNYKIVFKNQGQDVVLYVDAEQYGLTEGKYSDRNLVYSGRSQKLLEF